MKKQTIPYWLACIFLIGVIAYSTRISVRKEWPVSSIIVITDSTKRIITAKNPKDTLVVRVRKDADGGTLIETKDGMILQELNAK